MGAIPDSVVMLNLRGNKCCDDEHYRLQLVLNLPNLRVGAAALPSLILLGRAGRDDVDNVAAVMCFVLPCCL